MNPPASERENIDRSKSKLPCRRTGSSKGNQPVTGFGCYVDVNTGAKIVNPGMTSEQVVCQMQPPLGHDPDVSVRFVIPNEREIRATGRVVDKQVDVPAYRTISFKGDGANVINPTNLPFQPPGLQWNGKKAVTARHLLKKLQKKKGSSSQTT
ncbi:unnamed protein product [Cuscuta epithymum]|uniref:Uncharacterized protein n=1 Tax=Cuscuta epithymum TaxID=186058 RepID=A0AAV0FPT9_9ASTE|nr:unnamed protein product [Cuscuta epithymum]